MTFNATFFSGLPATDINALIASIAQNGAPTTTTSTTFTLTDPQTGAAFTLGGSGFSYVPAGLAGGTVNSITLTQGGSTIFTITGFSRTAAATNQLLIDFANAVPNAFANYVGNEDGVLTGSALIDDFNFGDGNDVLNGNAGNDILRGVGGNDTINGGDGDDELFDGSGTDTVNGGADNDLLFTAAASLTDGDVFNGGTGTDTLIIQNTFFNTGFVFDLGAQTTSFNGVGSFAIQNIEVLINQADQASSNEVMRGSAQNDEMESGGGNNQLFGFAGVDTLRGKSGDDLLDGGIGADTMAGGADNDTYIVDDIGDLVTELSGQGDDIVDTFVSYNVPLNVEVLRMQGAGDLSSTGTASRDIIQGNSGANIINGAGGADVMAGGAGNDVYAVDDSSDAVIEMSGEGQDAVYSSVDYEISGAQEIESAILTGNAVVLRGSSSDNQLFGNDQVNVIDGREGTDFMLGQGGADIFQINLEAGAVDVVGDFSKADGDRMAFTGFNAATTFVNQASATSFEVRDTKGTQTLADDTVQTFQLWDSYDPANPQWTQGALVFGVDYYFG